MLKPLMAPGKVAKAWARTRTAALIALTTCALAALPSASASAGSAAVVPLEASQVEHVLEQVPLGTLDTERLVETLQALPGLKGIEASVLETALREAIEALKEKAANVGELLGSPAAVSELETALKEALGPLSGTLETLLGGNPATRLTEILQGFSPAALLGELLGKASNPGQVLTEALGSVDPKALEALLGSLLSGQPFIKSTVEEVASAAGVTPAGFAEELGKTAEEVPPTAMALVSALKNGNKLGVFKGASGLVFSVLGASGPGGAGGTGGTGAAGAPAAGAGNPAAKGVATATARRVRIVSRRVRKHVLTVVVAAPSAGTLSLSGKAFKPLRRRAAKAGNVTLRTPLTRKAVASLKRHGRHTRRNVAVTVRFTPSSGAASSATTKVAFG